MAIIKKKTSPKYFELIKSGKKKFEFRMADFVIKEGDTLILEEWNQKTKQYTGRKIKKTAKYIFKFVEVVTKLFLLQFYLFGYDFVRLRKNVFSVAMLRFKHFCLPSLSRQKI